MQKVKEFSYIDISKILFGKKVHFVSDCEFFPNFDIICLVNDIYIGKSNEIMFKVKVLDSNKVLIVGSNMKNLQFEII